jgi:hypothetical protein
MAGGGVGGSFGRGSQSVAFPKAFPPIGVYQLEIQQFGPPAPASDDVIAIEGPLVGGPRSVRAMPGDVWYRRVIVPSGGQAALPSRNFRDTDRQVYRRAYLADLVGMSVDQAEALFCATTGVRWQSEADFVRETQQAMASQAKSISDFVTEAGKSGLGDVSGVQLTINPVVQDRRSSSAAQAPLPSIGPEEIKLH